MPFAFPHSNHRFECHTHDYQTSSVQLMKKLAKASQLRSLTLVMPDHCFYRHSSTTGVAGKILEGLKTLCAAKPFLEFRIIRMGDISNGSPVLQLVRSQVCIIKTLRSMSLCSVRFAAYSSSGDWHIAKGQPDFNHGGGVVARQFEFEEYLDILPDVARIFNAA